MTSVYFIFIPIILYFTTSIIIFVPVFNYFFFSKYQKYSNYSSYSSCFLSKVYVFMLSCKVSHKLTLLYRMKFLKYFNCGQSKIILYCKNTHIHIHAHCTVYSHNWNKFPEKILIHTTYKLLPFSYFVSYKYISFEPLSWLLVMIPPTSCPHHMKWPSFSAFLSLHPLPPQLSSEECTPILQTHLLLILHFI